jgi:hypothetical protein
LVVYDRSIQAFTWIEGLLEHCGHRHVNLVQALARDITKPFSFMRVRGGQGQADPAGCLLLVFRQASQNDRQEDQVIDAEDNLQRGKRQQTDPDLIGAESSGVRKSTLRNRISPG